MIVFRIKEMRNKKEISLYKFPNFAEIVVFFILL